MADGGKSECGAHGLLLSSIRDRSAAQPRLRKRLPASQGRGTRYCGVSVQVPMAALAMASRLVAISMYSTLAQRSANER